MGDASSKATEFVSGYSYAPNFVPAQTGAFMHTEYVGVRMRVYPIDEGRLDSISVLNGIATVLFSVGTGFWSFALGLARDLAIVRPDDVPNGVPGMAQIIYWMCGLVTLACYAGGVALVAKRYLIFRGIKRKTVELEVADWKAPFEGSVAFKV